MGYVCCLWLLHRVKNFSARHSWSDPKLLTDDHKQEDNHHQRYDRLHLQEEHRGGLHMAPYVAPAPSQLEKRFSFYCVLFLNSWLLCPLPAEGRKPALHLVNPLSEPQVLQGASMGDASSWLLYQQCHLQDPHPAAFTPTDKSIGQVLPLA